VLAGVGGDLLPIHSKKSRFSEHQILAILRQAETGTPVAELCRETGMSSATFYNWRSKYGGIDPWMMVRIKELEAENRRLKKMYAQERLKAEIVQEALEKIVRPSRRREMARTAVEQRKLSIRLACEEFCISDTYYRYQPKRSDEDAEVVEWLVGLTQASRC
jgi:putative transposase